MIPSTEDAVLWNEKVGDTEVVIEVDLPAVEEPKHTMPAINFDIKELTHPNQT